MKNKIIIFTGPSINPDEARKILKADYKPPAGRGDVLIALKDNPHVIGIIDGVFHQRPAVSHKEILNAMERSVKVVGGGSMGALRASELDDMGMIGIGKVYNAYKNGLIESDDDVAVVFNPQTLEQLSEALISMDYNFKMAYSKGIISSEEFNDLYNTAKSIYYPKRTYKLVISNSNLKNSQKDKLQRYIMENGRDIKKEDAEMVLKYIRDNLMV